MIVRIGYDDTVRVGNGNVVRMFELSFVLAAGTELSNKGSIRLENLENVILSVKYLR